MTGRKGKIEECEVEISNRSKEALHGLGSKFHEVWASWMRYMFAEGGSYLPGGFWVMRSEKVKRWNRQMATPYEALSLQERLSDLQVIAEHLPGLLTEEQLAYIEELNRKVKK